MRPGHCRLVGVAQERSALPEVGLLPHRNPVTGLVEEVVPRMSATPVMPEAQERVVIAVDPHTASWTALAITADLSAVGALRVPANQDGYRRLRRLAARWPQGSWAIENAAAPGRTVDRTATGRRHRGAGETGPPDTPALGRTRSQNDKADALSVAPSLNTVAAGRGHRRCASVDRAPRRSRPHPHPRPSTGCTRFWSSSSRPGCPAG